MSAHELFAENQVVPKKICWDLLRAHRMADLKFRRRHPVGPYFADFACVSRKLVIEIDRAAHGERSFLLGTRAAGEMIAAQCELLEDWNVDSFSRAVHIALDPDA